MSENRHNSSSDDVHGRASQSGTPRTDAEILAALRERREQRRLQMEASESPPIDEIPDSTPDTDAQATPTAPTPGSSSVVPGTPVAPARDNRVCLAPDENGILEFPSTIVGKLWDIYALRADPNGTRWKKMSQETIDFYWGEFHKIASWDPEHASIVKKEWLRKNVQRYRDYTWDIRKNKKPYPDDEAVAEKWKAEWNSAAYKAKQAQAKLNRRGGKEMEIALPTHTGGCRTFLATKKWLEKKKKRVIPIAELHDYCHTKKHEKENWVVPKSKEYDEDFRAVTQGLTPDMGQAAIDDLDRSFYHVVGGHNKKKLVYGVGSLSRVIPEAGKETSTPSSSSRSEIAILKEQLSEVIVAQQRVEQRQDTIEEEIQKIRGSQRDRSLDPDDDGLGGDFGLTGDFSNPVY